MPLTLGLSQGMDVNRPNLKMANIHNFKPGASGNLQRWRTVRGGNGKLLCVGNSKTMGAGTGTADGLGTFSAGAAPLAWPKILADKLAAAGISVIRQSTCGMHGLSTMAQIKAYDVRVGGLTSWVVGDLSLGGRLIQSATPNVDTYSFAPEVAVDKVDVYYETGAARGIFTVKDGAATVATIDCSVGGTGFAKTTVSLSSLAAGKTININRTATNALAVHIGLIVAYDSTTPSIKLINAGWYGSKGSDWTSVVNPWSASNAIDVVDPDLTIIALCANGLGNSVAAATEGPLIQVAIDKAKLSGDVVLVNEATGQRPTWGTAQTQLDYHDMVRALAVTNNAPFVDFDLLLGGGYTYRPTYFADGVHDNAAACALEADALSFLLRAA